MVNTDLEGDNLKSIYCRISGIGMMRVMNQHVNQKESNTALKLIPHGRKSEMRHGHGLLMKGAMKG